MVANDRNANQSRKSSNRDLFPQVLKMSTCRASGTVGSRGCNSLLAFTSVCLSVLLPSGLGLLTQRPESPWHDQVDTLYTLSNLGGSATSLF